MWTKLPRKIFLGGPIQHAFLEGSFNGDIREFLLAVIRALEVAGFTVLSAHRYERFGEVNMEGLSSEVTARDFCWMRACDLFVAVLPSVDGELLRTDGTCIELGWASALGKPVVMVRDSCNISHLMNGLGAISPALVLGYDLVKKNPPILVDEIMRFLLASEADSRQLSQKNSLSQGGAADSWAPQADL